MNTVARRFLEEELVYTGKELRARWIEEVAALTGDAIVAFRGPADVPVENLVDREDVERNAPIFSPLMLHFIAEHVGIPLENAVLRQRLLMAIIAEELRICAQAEVVRCGDDLYDGDRKLSVSVAAPSPTSCCIHTGMNIRCEGTPVRTIGLDDYGIEPIAFGKLIMKRYAEELASVEHACAKVRPIP